MLELLLSNAAILSFLSSTLMLDHIALEDNKNLYFSHVHPLSPVKEFHFMDCDYFKNEISRSQGCYYINDLNHLEDIGQREVLKICNEHGLKSIFYSEISFNKKIYGYLRGESTSKVRIWQYGDMDLLISAANIIAMSLHYKNESLDTL